MAEERDLDLGTAGASGRHEHERRRANRESHVRERHPRIGGLLLRLQDTPAHEKAWETGAAGEEALAKSLLKRCPDVPVLHDRAMPGSRANIDHLAVAPSGIYVIDAKRYKGKIEVRRPLFGDEKLLIAGRDKTKLVEGLKRQVEAVQAVVESLARPLPVHGCFCFVNPDGQAGGSGIPTFRTLKVDGFSLYYPRRLAKRLSQPGEIDDEQTQLLVDLLVQRFSPAR